MTPYGQAEAAWRQEEWEVAVVKDAGELEARASSLALLWLWLALVAAAWHRLGCERLRAALVAALA